MFDYKDLIERLLSKNNKLLYGKHNFFISSSMLWVKNYINSLPMKTNKSKNKKPSSYAFCNKKEKCLQIKSVSTLKQAHWGNIEDGKFYFQTLGRYAHFIDICKSKIEFLLWMSITIVRPNLYWFTC